MQSVKIKNMETEESVWLNIPSSYQTVREVFVGLGEPEMVQIVSAEGQDTVLEKHLAGKMLRRENGLNKLEFLNLRLEGMTQLEKEIFLAAMEIEEPYTLMEIVNLSCNLDKFTVYHGAADETLLGNDILEHRKEVLVGYSETQEKAVGRRYAREHAGCFSESGYIFRSGKAIEAVYDGKHCPDPAYDSNAVFMVLIPVEKGGKARKKALSLALPASDEKLAVAAGNLERYRFLPKEVSEPEVYARYALRDWLLQVDERLDDFIDFEGYGKYRIRADGVVQTEYGVLERTDRPLLLLPEEVTSFKLFSPLRGSIYPRDGCFGISDHATDLYSCDLGMYEDSIREMVEKECGDLDARSGLAAYISNCLLKRKVASMMPTVENWRDELWGVLEVKVHRELTDGELKELMEEWTGQASDGWGESFEQRPIQVADGKLYVSFWNSDSDFFIKTEEELKNLVHQSFSMQMGGM